MNTEVRRCIEDHARSNPAREVCGFVYPDRYVPLQNQSANPRRFEADPRDVARALALYGEPLAIFHSHPHGPPRPSESDLQNYYYISSFLLIGHMAADGSLTLSSFYGPGQIRNTPPHVQEFYGC